MLPWSKEPRKEIADTEYSRFLAQASTSKSRSRVTKHAIYMASSLLRDKQGEKEHRRVAWHQDGHNINESR